MTTNAKDRKRDHDVYRCPNCHKRFRRLMTNVSCCILHAPSDCCHAFEQRVSKKGWPIVEHRPPFDGGSPTTMQMTAGSGPGWRTIA